ncbi:hypothetical protein NE237_019618 [Protea cynaroides]|uniref:Uncharacterized protein n=1 Tax=Protea cynaroides TaxID=273540 RepID=A0A9Q0H7H0_9MAGN|nr:hypothetical protein NE237_019618 [Protea cynaroides]
MKNINGAMGLDPSELIVFRRRNVDRSLFLPAPAVPQHMVGVDGADLKAASVFFPSFIPAEYGLLICGIYISSNHFIVESVFLMIILDIKSCSRAEIHAPIAIPTLLLIDFVSGGDPYFDMFILEFPCFVSFINLHGLEFLVSLSFLQDASKTTFFGCIILRSEPPRQILLPRLENVFPRSCQSRQFLLSLRMDSKAGISEQVSWSTSAKRESKKNRPGHLNYKIRDAFQYMVWRFAEKKQVGNYYSTKIWSFTMKSACCEYVIIIGAQRKTEDFDIEDAETFELPADEERGKLADPFYRLEHQEKDMKKKKEAELQQKKRVAEEESLGRWALGYDYFQHLQKMLLQQRESSSPNLKRTRMKRQ